MMTPEGGLFESNAIARYVARQGDAKLLGTTNYENVRPRTTLAIPGWAGSGHGSATSWQGRCTQAVPTWPFQSCMSTKRPVLSIT